MKRFLGAILRLVAFFGTVIAVAIPAIAVVLYVVFNEDFAAMGIPQEIINTVRSVNKDYFAYGVLALSFMLVSFGTLCNMIFRKGKLIVALIFGTLVYVPLMYLAVFSASIPVKHIDYTIISFIGGITNKVAVLYVGTALMYGSLLLAALARKLKRKKDDDDEPKDKENVRRNKVSTSSKSPVPESRNVSPKIVRDPWGNPITEDEYNSRINASKK